MKFVSLSLLRAFAVLPVTGTGVHWWHRCLCPQGVVDHQQGRTNARGAQDALRCHGSTLLFSSSHAHSLMEVRLQSKCVHVHSYTKACGSP